MSIKFNPFILEGLDIAGGSSNPAIGSTPIVGSNGNSILTTDDTGVLSEKVLTDGQLLVGSTGNEPVATTLTGTANQVAVTNAPGSVTLSLPQDIATTSSPSFAAVNTPVIDRSTPGTLTIGAVNADTINIGNPGSQVNLQGDVNILNSTILEVTNPLILINEGGPATSAGGAGIEVEEDNLVTGYTKVAADRTAWELKAPAQAGVIKLEPSASGTLTINQALFDSKYDASNPNGYETPAQLDARDTANRDRANHTGTQLASTISDFTEASQDAVGSAITAGVQDGVSVVYDDVNNKIDVTNLDKGSDAVTAHELESDPHPQYETAVEAQAKVDAHANLTNNPHAVTKAQVGLGNVDNTSDLDKPISTATQTALDLKANTADLGDLALLDTVDTNEIVNHAVTNVKLATMNSNTLKGRASGNGTAQDLTASEVRGILEVETTTQLDSRDTANRDRANHTGTQLASTISDFDEAAQDAAAAAFLAGSQDGVSVTYANDALNAIDISNTDKGSTAVATHESALDPHPQYLTPAEADLLYDVLGSAAAVQTNLDNHIADTTDAHAASAITVTPSGNLLATNVQAALEEIQLEVDSLAGGTGANTTLSNLVAPTAINQDLLPNSNATRTLGSAANNWLSANIQTITGVPNVTLQSTTGTVSILTATRSTPGSSGAITVSSGNKTGGLGGSGVVVVTSGDSSGASAASGSVTIKTGTGTSNSNSGNVTVTTGDGTSSSGSVSITSGAGGNSTGAINITSGDATGNLSGNVTITTGTASSLRGALIIDVREVNVSSTKIVNVQDPTDPQDAATKAYVDAVAASPVTTVSLPNNTADISVLDLSTIGACIFQYTISRQTDTFNFVEIGTIHAIQNAAGNWTLANGGIAGDALVSFRIDDTLNELLCTTSDISGTGYVGTITYKLVTF